MSTTTLSHKLFEETEPQVVLSPAGEPAYLQIPWQTVSLLTEGELETLEILMDPWWRKNLLAHYREYRKDPNAALRNAISWEDYRDQRKKT